MPVGLGWLIGASDELIETGIKIEPGSIRRKLIEGIAAIERRDAEASLSVSAEVIWFMRRELSEMLDAHTRFFTDELQCVLG